ncbi:MAG: hypothetical protein ACRDIB_15450, partial [Ardenticatenaceae bacterium]
MQTVVALYVNGTKAADAAEALLADGFPPEDVGILARDTDSELAELVSDPAAEEIAGVSPDEGSDTAAGAGIGALLGGTAGLLIGLGALVIPGIGPIIAAGPLAATLIGAGVGAVAGGAIAALTDMGIPEEEAREYAEAIRHGSAIVAVQADDDRADRAADILYQFAPMDLAETTAVGQDEAWE